LRLVTWNIWNGGEGRVDEIERVLREQQADVVALQEANDRETIETLGSRLGMEVVYGDANSAFAVAWLSRLPVTRTRNQYVAQSGPKRSPSSTGRYSSSCASAHEIRSTRGDARSSSTGRVRAWINVRRRCDVCSRRRRV